MIDLIKWEQIAAQQIHNRKQIAGRLGGKIAVVTGSAQGFGKGIRIHSPSSLRARAVRAPTGPAGAGRDGRRIGGARLLADECLRHTGPLLSFDSSICGILRPVR